MRSSTPGQRLHRFPHPVLSVLIIVAVCGFAFHSVAGYWFTGQDSFPLILSAAAVSIGDVLRLFRTEFLSAYANQDIAGSVGFRPVVMMTFAFDHWIWGMDPRGYHITDVLIHTANAVLLFGLVRALHRDGSPVIALAAALLFSVQPIHARTVPVIPARFDLVMGTCVLLFLMSLLRYLRTQRTRYLLMASAMALIALGAKETAIAIVPMSLVTALLFSQKGMRPGRAIAIPVGVVAAVCMAALAYRQWVLIGVGGYPIAFQPFPRGLVWGTYLFLEPLVLPVGLSGSPVVDQAARAITAAFFGILLLALAGNGLRRRVRTGASTDPDILDRVAMPGAMWLLCLLALYLATYQVSGVLQLWYLYVPAMMSSVVLVGVAGHCIGRVSGRGTRRPATRAVRWIDGFGVVAVAAVIVGLVLRPPARSGMREWGRASHFARSYLDSLAEAVEEVPDSATIVLVNLPYGFECASRCISRATMLADYTVDSWLRLFAPTRSIAVGAATRIWLPANGALPVSRLHFDIATGTLVAETSAGRGVEAEYSLLAHALSAAIGKGAAPQRDTIVIHREQLRAPVYIYDVFSAEKLIRIAGPASSPTAGEPSGTNSREPRTDLLAR